MSLTDPTNEPVRKARSPLRAILPYTTVAMVLAMLYAAWTFYSRHQESQRAAQAIEDQKAQQNKQIVDQVYGSGEVKLMRFSADKGVLARGESTQLCYGVVNATKVEIDPPIEALKPTYTHCMEIKPVKTTTYTLKASDAAGHVKTGSLTIQVK